MTEEYKKFKSELAVLCERGRIRKETKKKLSGFDNTETVGGLIYSVCAALTDIFGAGGDSGKECGCICACVNELILSLKKYVAGLEHDFAVVGAYITLTEKACGEMSVDALKKMQAHAEEYNRSLQNIKFGLPLF